MLYWTRPMNDIVYWYTILVFHDSQERISSCALQGPLDTTVVALEL